MAAPDPALIETRILPRSRWPGFGLAEVWRFRELLMVLTRRLLKVRYRQTVIGVGWAVGQPLLLMLVFTVFFGMLARINTDGLPYPVFYFSGLAVWAVISKVVMDGSQSVVQNAALVERVYFPRIYLPVALALSTLVDLACNIAALGVLLVIYGIVPGIGMVTLPVLMAVAYGVSMGAAFWMGALNVPYRDVTVLLPVIVQAWFFATPIIYPASLVAPELQPIYYLNPAALVVEGTRWAFTGAAAPPLFAWAEGIVVAGLVFVTGYLFFRQRQGTFADVV